MNALIPITDPITPLQAALLAIARQECAARSIRTGITERPGGLPASLYEKRGVLSSGSIARRAQIIAALSNGPMRSMGVYTAIGSTSQVTHNTLSSMHDAGLVTYTKRPNCHPVWALAEGVQP